MDRRSALTVVLVLTGLCAPAPLWAQMAPDEADRETDMFGGDASQAPEALPEALPGATPLPAVPTARVPRLEEFPDEKAGRLSTVAPPAGGVHDLQERVERNNDYLDVGGFYFLRGEYDMLETGSFADFPLISPNLLDIYFDARPSDRVRGYMRTRALYDPTVRAGQVNPLTLGRAQQTTLILNQLWLKFDVARTAYITVGRQPVRWGAGRFWNPTDFLNKQRLNPLAIFDERLGATLVKVNVPFESLGWNLYAVANVSQVQRPSELGGALRAEILFGQTELSLTAGRGPQQGPWQLGIDASSGLGLFDVHLEAAFQQGVKQAFYRDNGNGGPPQSFSRDDQWLAQLVAGTEFSLRYSDDDTIALGVEYFYNQLGFDNANQYPLAIADFLRQDMLAPFLYLGRQYVAAYANLNQPGAWNNTNVTVSLVSNLTDKTVVSRLDWRLRFLTYLDINFYGTYHFGDQGEMHFAIRDVPGLPVGFSRPAPRSEVGIGLRLYF